MPARKEEAAKDWPTSLLEVGFTVDEAEELCEWLQREFESPVELKETLNTIDDLKEAVTTELGIGLLRWLKYRGRFAELLDVPLTGRSYRSRSSREAFDGW